MGDKRNPKRGRAPVPISGTAAQIGEPADHNKDTPKFCLRHLQRDFDIHSLPTNRRAAFAMALQKRATMKWQEIVMADRHGLGSESIPREAIKAPIPPAFQDAGEFLVLRYDGLLPMVGVRAGAVYHILWIEPEFGRLYNHG